MPRVAMNFRYFADWAEQMQHEDLEIRGHRERITFDPAGVVAIITPWNAPLMLATWRIGRRSRPATPSWSSRRSGHR